MKSYLNVKDKWREEINGNKVELYDGKISIEGQEVPISGYEIISYIGSGANGVVFECKEKTTDQIRAIKIWLPNSSQGKSNKTRGNEEIKKISKLQHPNIVRYYYSEVIDGHRYCIMEKIDGKSLSEYITENHPLLDKRYSILQEILEGLRYCHEKDIYHGDLHLDNIIVDNNTKLKILDFGTSVFGKGYSLARDSRLMYESTKKILGDYYCDSLVKLYGVELAELSPRIIRLICKSLSKITVLLDFSKYGINKAIINDIAMFAMLVPFFDIRYILNAIVHYSKTEDSLENSQYFMKCLLNESGKKVELYKLLEVVNGKYVPIKVNKGDIYAFYEDIQKRFIKLNNEHNEEKYIYFSSEEAKIFKSDLYGRVNTDYMTIDEEKLHYIDEVLNS